jgi:hypothetical protein
LAISNLFGVLAHQPNLRPHSARQATQPFAPFPTLLELSNFASPPAEPEDFLGIKQFLIAGADKIGDAAAGVLQTYIEKKLLGL